MRKICIKCELGDCLIALPFLLIAGVIGGYIFFIQFDCLIRINYWNDNGLFIDSWSYDYFKCDYPPIPNRDRK